MGLGFRIYLFVYLFIFLACPNSVPTWLTCVFWNFDSWLLMLCCWPIVQKTLDSPPPHPPPRPPSPNNTHFMTILSSEKKTQNRCRSCLLFSACVCLHRMPLCAHPDRGKLNFRKQIDKIGLMSGSFQAQSIPLLVPAISTFYLLFSSLASKTQFSSPLEYKLHIKCTAQRQRACYSCLCSNGNDN